eukprot:14000108-Alexandrium_andersonii.AAC.1
MAREAPITPSDGQEVCQFMVHCPCCGRFKAKSHHPYETFGKEAHDDLLLRLLQHADALQHDL